MSSMKQDSKARRKKKEVSKNREAELFQLFGDIDKRMASDKFGSKKGAKQPEVVTTTKPKRTRKKRKPTEENAVESPTRRSQRVIQRSTQDLTCKFICLFGPYNYYIFKINSI